MDLNIEQTKIALAKPQTYQSLPVGSEFGQYIILELIGRGGMGEVYKVRHRTLGSTFAIKLIAPEIAANPGMQERFINEAKVMARLRHPGIVNVDDFGETNGCTWLRMELIENSAQTSPAYTASPKNNPETDSKDSAQPYQQGASLADYLQAKGTPLPQNEVCDIIGQILSALDYAHREGAVHRDLKPANVLVSLDSFQTVVKIVDFGLVSLVGEQWLRTQVQQTVARSMAMGTEKTTVQSESTVAGSAEKALLGTYAYMAPEQKEGYDGDHRSDLYAVGLMAFQMLTGENNLGLELPSEIHPELDSNWDKWIKQALATKPERRFASASDMLAALRNIPLPSTFTAPTQKTPEPVSPDQPVQEFQPLNPSPSALPMEPRNLKGRIAFACCIGFSSIIVMTAVNSIFYPVSNNIEVFSELEHIIYNWKNRALSIGISGFILGFIIFFTNHSSKNFDDVFNHCLNSIKNSTQKSRLAGLVSGVIVFSFTGTAMVFLIAIASNAYRTNEDLIWHLIYLLSLPHLIYYAIIGGVVGFLFGLSPKSFPHTPIKLPLETKDKMIAAVYVGLTNFFCQASILSTYLFLIEASSMREIIFVFLFISISALFAGTLLGYNTAFIKTYTIQWRLIPIHILQRILTCSRAQRFSGSKKGALIFAIFYSLFYISITIYFLEQLRSEPSIIIIFPILVFIQAIIGCIIGSVFGHDPEAASRKFATQEK